MCRASVMFHGATPHQTQCFIKCSRSVTASTTKIMFTLKAENLHFKGLLVCCFFFFDDTHTQVDCSI